MSALKWTARRQRFGAAINAGKVRHYQWKRPYSRWEDVPGGIWSIVTAEVRRWVAAGLATIPAPDDVDLDRSTVTLTPAGKAWLAQHGGTT